MDFLAENSVYFYGISIVLTICALVASTRYTMKNILKVWGGEKKITDADDRRENELDDGRGSEGDDEAEDEAGQGDRIERIKKDLEEREIDPVEYCEHIQGEVKRVKQKVATKKIQESMSPEQLQAERDIQRQQLEQIFSLMKEQEDKFGVKTVTDIQEQMKLYC
ncbi:hypothetical protein SNE40_005336 [Patella caerulea]